MSKIFGTNLSDKQKAMLLMVAAGFLWSLGGIFIKLISWSPFLIAGVRSMISGCVMLGYMRWRGVKYKMNRYSFGAGIGLSFSAILFTIATKMTTAANAIVLQYTAPVFVLIMSAVFFGQKMKKREIWVVGITMAGMVLFFFDQLSPGNVAGNILGVMAGVFLALMLVMVGRGGDDDSTRLSGLLNAHTLTMMIGVPSGIMLTSWWGSGSGEAGTVAFSLRSSAYAMPVWVEDLTGTVGVLPLEILYILILGVFQLGIPYVLYGIASKDCSPLACSLIAMIEPLFNPVWVAIFIGEVPGVFALVGAAVIIAVVTWWCVADSRSGDG